MILREKKKRADNRINRTQHKKNNNKITLKVKCGRCMICFSVFVCKPVHDKEIYSLFFVFIYT